MDYIIRRCFEAIMTWKTSVALRRLKEGQPPVCFLPTRQGPAQLYFFPTLQDLWHPGGLCCQCPCANTSSGEGYGRWARCLRGKHCHLLEFGRKASPNPLVFPEQWNRNQENILLGSGVGNLDLETQQIGRSIHCSASPAPEAWHRCGRTHCLQGPCRQDMSEVGQVRGRNMASNIQP